MADPGSSESPAHKTATKSFSLYSSAWDNVHNITYNNISDLFTVGAGQVNITAALASSDLVTVPAISPLAVMNSNGQVTLMFAQNIVWGHKHRVGYQHCLGHHGIDGAVSE